MQAAEVLVGTTGKYIERTANRLYPLEYANENLIDVQPPKAENINIKNNRQPALSVVLGFPKRGQC